VRNAILAHLLQDEDDLPAQVVVGPAQRLGQDRDGRSTDPAQGSNGTCAYGRIGLVQRLGQGGKGRPTDLSQDLGGPGRAVGFRSEKHLPQGGDGRPGLRAQRPEGPGGSPANLWIGVGEQPDQCGDGWAADPAERLGGGTATLGVVGVLDRLEQNRDGCRGFRTDPAQGLCCQPADCGIVPEGRREGTDGFFGPGTEPAQQVDRLPASAGFRVLQLPQQVRDSSGRVEAGVVGVGHLCRTSQRGTANTLRA
jgi:hypothetical protein